MTTNYTYVYDAFKAPPWRRFTFVVVVFPPLSCQRKFQVVYRIAAHTQTNKQTIALNFAQQNYEIKRAFFVPPKYPSTRVPVYLIQLLYYLL